MGSVAALMSGCIDPKTGVDDTGTLATSWVRPEDPQEQIGRQEHPAIIAKYGGVYSNVKAERLIAVIVGKLVAVSDDPTRVYKITLLDSPKVNAFALPGGFLYLTRGLLALANDSSEVAAVIAHEMAHVSADHAIVRQEKLSSVAIGEQVVSDVLNGNTAGKVALAANRLKLTEFSQDQELQADAIGIRLAGRAGYDPFAAMRFLNTMDAYQKFLNGSNDFSRVNDFASSHPSTPRRIELAQRHARFFGAPGVGDRAKDRYFEGIDGIFYGDTSEEGFVRGQTFAHSGLGVTFQAPVGFTIDNQTKAVMISGPNDILTQFDATVISSRTSAVEYLQGDWVKGLVDETIRGETINGLETATASARAESSRFKVRVIKDGKQLFRFITGAPQTNLSLDAVSRQITGSFRKLSESEIANLKPLSVIIARYNGQPLDQFAASKMQGTDKKLALFKLINGLSGEDVPETGQRVKVIAEQ